MRQYDQTEKCALAARLAGGVSHDVSNRIGGIAGLATIIRMKSEDAKIKQTAESILNACRAADISAKTLLNIIRDDRQPNDMIINAHESINTAADLLYNGLSMRTKFQCDLNAKRHFISADPIQLQCALLDTGLKLSDNGDTVTISTDNTTESNVEYITITVSGSGTEETMSFPISEKA